MTRRYDDQDVIGARAPLEELPLFAEVKANWAEKYTPAERARDIERLVPLARELAERGGRAGVRVENLRIAAVQRGILTGEEQGKRLSYLGSVMKRAGLVNSGVPLKRNQVIRKTHGNPGVTWVLPQYREGAA